MNAFIALLRKDLVLYFSNRRSVIMSILAPILIAAFFGSLFGGATTSRPTFRSRSPTSTAASSQ